MFQETEPFSLSRHANGCDYGRPRRLLLQRGTLTLTVHPGHNGWSGVGQSSWYATRLVLDDGLGWRGEHKDLHSGRITKAVLEVHRECIAEWFGVSVDELPALRTNKSFVWHKEETA